MRQSTVVIPAYNAEDTIRATISSIETQTVANWHAIVVNDGSTDATEEIVSSLAAQDPRISCVASLSSGVAGARNTGIAEATTNVVSFLDADDLLDPEFLERMLPPLEDPSVTATYCGWQRLAPDGTVEDGPCPDVDGDLFDLFAAACVFPPHACVVRRDVLIEVGGFDERPSTTEDWDLWLKIARTGARFVRVHESLVRYRMRAGSRSRDFRRVLEDGLGVIATGHREDPRVTNPHPSHRDGRAAMLEGVAAISHSCWAAGMAAASGSDPLSVLAAIRSFTAPGMDPWVVAGTLAESIRVTLCVPPSQGILAIAPLVPAIREFLPALEVAAASPGLADQSARALDALLCSQAEFPAAQALLSTFLVTLDLDQLLPDTVRVPAGCDVLVARLRYAAVNVGDVEMAVSEGSIPRDELSHAIAAKYHRELIAAYLAETALADIDFVASADGATVTATRRAQVVATGLPADSGERRTALHDEAGWLLVLQEVFQVPHLTIDDLEGGRLPAETGTVTVVHGHLDYDLTDTRTDLMSGAPFSVTCSIGGFPLGTGEALGPGLVRAGVLAKRAIGLDPTRLSIRIVECGVIGWPASAVPSLRDRLRGNRSSGS